MIKLMIVVVIVLACLTGVAASSGSQSEVVTLTHDGRVAWEVEALLRDTFGAKQPALETRDTNFSCAGAGCSPLSRYSPYIYLFSNARHSGFRLVARSFAGGAFANATPIRIKGRYVACDSPANTFVVRYANAFGSFTCMTPL